MEEKDVNVGDVVVLNSGLLVDPEKRIFMTVTRVDDRMGGDVECSWFSNGIVMNEAFQNKALTKVQVQE